MIGRRVLALGCFLAASPFPALAGGPGSYTVQGTSMSGSPYSGTLVIARNGDRTFKLTWTIGNTVTEGSGVGDEEGMAVAFQSANKTGSSLFMADGAGGYKSIWSYFGDANAGLEDIKPR